MISIWPQRIAACLAVSIVLTLGTVSLAQNSGGDSADGAGPDGKSIPGQKAEDAADAPDDADAPKPGAKKVANGPKQVGETKPPTEKKRRDSPIGDLFKRILRPGGGARNNGFQLPTADGPPSEILDPRAPRDRDRSNLIDKAKSFSESGQWKPAMDVLQHLLDRPGDSLIRTADGNWSSARREADRLLGAMPPQALQAYRLQYDGVAERLLHDARQSGRLQAYGELAGRYFYTEPGFEAANLLGTAHFDHGEFSMATRWFEKLQRAGAARTNDPVWQVKAVCAARLAAGSAEDGTLVSELSQKLGNRPVRVGGEISNARRWTESELPVDPQQQLVMHDWPLLYGNPGRTGKVAGGEPLLLPRWSQPTTYSEPIREQTDFLLDDLTDQERAAIPAFVPLAVDGKILFRTLRGVSVVDAASGELLWETSEKLSAERLLTGGNSRRRSSRSGRRWDNRGLLGQYENRSAESHPLTGLLYRNGTVGILSSDRRQLFVLEDQAILSEQQMEYTWQGQNTDPNDYFGRDWSTNRLVSYDLSTGRPLWEVGGREMHEPFDPPLAGTYFFGVPVPDGDELYLVGEKNNEIRLHALDSRTGKPRWSQLLAFSESKIEADIPRRFWPAQVAVADGLIVCPTTVGWLVAVDQVDHSVVWAHPLSAPSPAAQPNQQRMSSAYPLNSWWCPSAPIILGNRVLYTPSEEDFLVCLDLKDGKRLWNRSKEEMLYLAGTHDGLAILVGKRSVVGARIEDGGRSAWQKRIPKESGYPSGRGVIVDGKLLLPLRSGELWLLDLNDGEVVSRFFQGPPEKPLGNLAMYDGMLLSLDGTGLTSFEQRQAVEKTIQQRTAQNPRDPWSLIREAAILQLERKYADALARLTPVRQDELPDHLKSAYREALVKSLVAVIRADSGTHNHELDLLATVIEGDQERITYLQLLAEQALAQQDYAAAFDVCEKLAAEDGSIMVGRKDESDVTLRLDSWVSGKFAELLSNASDELRPQLEARIAAAAEEALGAAQTDRERLTRVFGFHSASYPVQLALAEEYIAENAAYRAEQILENLWRHGNAETSAQAMARLGQLYLDLALPADAAACYQLLASERPDITLPDGRTVAAIVEDAQQNQGLSLETQTAPVRWGTGEMRLARSNTTYEIPVADEVELSDVLVPFFRQHQVHMQHQAHRLTVTEPATGNLYWTAALRDNPHGQQTYTAPGRAAGHQLVVLYRDVVHSLSLLDRRIAWAVPLDSRGAATHYRQPSKLAYQPMSFGRHFASTNELIQRFTRNGMLAEANSDYVCIHGRRSFSVLDATTGEVRWTRGNVAPQTTVFGGDGVVYVWPQDRTKTAAYSSLDGKELTVFDLPELLSKTVCLLDRSLVLVEQPSRKNSSDDDEDSKITIRSYDPVSQTEAWRVEFPEHTSFSLSENRAIVALDGEGAVTLLDLQKGTVVPLGNVPTAIQRSGSQIYTILDDNRLFVLVNRAENFALHYDNLPSIWSNGTLYAFDLHEAKQLWKREVSQQNMMLTEFASSPVLVFATRRYDRRSRYYTLHLLAIDKQSGQTMLDYSAPTSYGTFQSMSVNVRQQYVELRTYNERIRLEATADDTASTEGPERDSG